MRDSELQESTRRTVETPDYEIETCVAYNYAAGPGEYQVRLNPDVQALPAPVRPYLTSVQARALAGDLLTQADEADARNGNAAAPQRAAAAVESFLDTELQRDDMTLAEIAAEVVKIAREAG